MNETLGKGNRRRNCSKSVNTLQSVLNLIEEGNKRDAYNYSRGHLNKSRLYQPPEICKHKPWYSSLPKKAYCLFRSSDQPKITKRSERSWDKNLGSDFSLPTPGKQRPVKSSHVLPSIEPTPHTHSKLNSREIHLPEVMPLTSRELENQVSPQLRAALPPGLDTLQSQYTFIPCQFFGVTKRDQYKALKKYEAKMLKFSKKFDQEVLSGIHIATDLQTRLQEELKNLSFEMDMPSAYKLNSYSTIFDHLIQNSERFGYILNKIKEEYDNYVAYLLDNYMNQEHLLRKQLSHLSEERLPRQADVIKAKYDVECLESKAMKLLEINESLRQRIQCEIAIEPDIQMYPGSPKPTPLPKKVSDMSFEEIVEYTKTQILKIIDDITACQDDLHMNYVPLIVCSLLEQCIKDTEVEVQKLMKQNEYFECSSAEMEEELKAAIIEADTSERDARRIWKKISYYLGYQGTIGDDDDDKSKWNWYIS